MATTSQKLSKSLPATESGYGILCRTKSNGEYQISQNPNSKKPFTLWKIDADGYLKIDSADTPQELYPLIPW